MSTTASLLTFGEFERLPAHGGPAKLELLEGELIELPPPVKHHMQVAHRLLFALKPLANPAAGLGEVYVEMGYRMGRNSWLRPDVSIEHSGQAGEQYLEGAPLLAVEIISGSNKAEDVDRKVKAYLGSGGREVWVVYPRTRSVWAFRPEGAREYQGVLRSELLGRTEIDLEAVFG